MTQSPLSLSYDLLASDYLAARHAHDDIKVQIASIGLPNKAARVLDVGCGSLRETAYLVADVGAFVGIDASIGMLELAKHVCGAKLVVGDIEAPFPFQKSQFTHVLAISVLHHVHNLKLFTEQLSCVAKRQSQVFILTNSPRQILERPTYEFFPGLAKRAAARFRDPGDVCAALEKNGFTVVCEPLLRPRKLMDSAFLSRISSRAFDSAFFLLTDDEWKSGLDKLRSAIISGVNVEYPRDRYVLRARRE